MSVAFVFPGQGSQSVGMGKALADTYLPARQVFAEIDAALGDKLTTVMWEGPADRLMLTENAQPALAAAGSISTADAARLVRTRGRAMQRAVPAGAGAMAALIGVDFEQAAAIAAAAAQGQVCQAANDNGGGQVVISGDRAAVERAVAIAKDKGVRRAMMLPVSGPFHSALMQPAADVMRDALAQVSIKPPAVPLVANVLARATSDPRQIAQGLVDQVTGTVRWRESVAFMAAAGVNLFYEVGAGKILSGLVKRIAEGAGAVTVGSPEEVAAFKVARGQAARG